MFLSTGKVNFDLFPNGSLRIATTERPPVFFANQTSPIHECECSVIELSREEVERLLKLLSAGYSPLRRQAIPDNLHEHG